MTLRSRLLIAVVFLLLAINLRAASEIVIAIYLYRTLGRAASKNPLSATDPIGRRQ